MRNGELPGLKAQNLIVVTGPVGGGKSTTAIALGSQLRSAGRAAAVVDLDDVYCMVRQGQGWAEFDSWTAAWRGCGALATAFFDTGTDAVVIDGEFFDANMVAELLTPIQSRIKTTLFALLVSYPETRRRVQGDESRRGRPSDNPDFLRKLHDQYTKAQPFLRENFICLEADRKSVEQLVQSMIHNLTGGRLYQLTSALPTSFPPGAEHRAAA